METTQQETRTDTAKPENGVPEAKQGMTRKKKIIRWVAVVALLVAMIYGVPRFVHSLTHETTDDASIDGMVVPVSPRVSGHINRVTVTDNQKVKKGDLLVEIDPRDFEIRLDMAKAGLEAAKAAGRGRNIAVNLTSITTKSELSETEDAVDSARAAVEEARARLNLSRSSLDQGKAEAESATARHQLDATDLKRYVELAKAQAVSSKDLDHARTAEQMSAAALAAAMKKIDTQKAMVSGAEATLKAAEANLRQVRARLVSAHAAPERVKQSRTQADVSGADIDRALAEVAQAELNLSYTKIVAPCDGFVTKKNVESGQFVQVGQSVLAVVSDDVWVTANFKETQMAHMKPGQPVDITLDAYPGITLKGHVDSIQHGTGSRFSLLPPENATGNFVKVVQRVPVKIVFEKPAGEEGVLLAQGMQVVPSVNIRAKGFPVEAPAMADPLVKPRDSVEKTGEGR
jgi:membrane fusion protein (multidrug efflux system)